MANIFFNGEKASKAEAVASSRAHISNYSECVCESKVVSDDGGHILQIMVEVSEPALSLLSQHPEFPLSDLIPKWEGWRTVVLKVPPGYIAAVVHGGNE